MATKKNTKGAKNSKASTDAVVEPVAEEKVLTALGHVRYTKSELTTLAQLLTQDGGVTKDAALETINEIGNDRKLQAMTTMRAVLVKLLKPKGKKVPAFKRSGGGRSAADHTALFEELDLGAFDDIPDVTDTSDVELD